MAKAPKFAIIYGRTDYFAEEGLRQVFVATVDEVKELALQFIDVIPDDLDDYKADINKWDGSDVLTVTHQDDDTFLFKATPITVASGPRDFADFAGFVSEFYHDSGDDEDSEDD
jgi:hypothetical protein